MRVLFGCFVGTAGAAALVLFFLACNDYDQPMPGTPQVTFATSAGISEPLAACGADAAASAGVLAADGMDTGVLTLTSDGWHVTGTESYDVTVSSPDGMLTIVDLGDPSDAGAPGHFALSAAQPSVSLRLRAGLQAGAARVDVAYAGRLDEYCLSLVPTPAAVVSLNVTGALTSLPGGWQGLGLAAQAYQADGMPVSVGELYSWTATACAYLSVLATSTPADGGAMANVLYLPPGWSQTRVTVSAAADGGGRSMCLTPFGVYDPDGGGPGCESATQPDGGVVIADSAAPEITCPPQ